MSSLYEATTEGITVSVRPIFLADQSDPDDGTFVWAYQVTIRNGGSRPIQLLRRRWLITDALGRVQEVEGAGVIGEQPLLDPGASFDYTSGVPLATASGFMEGSYLMVDAADGRTFSVTIPAFSLDSPHAAARLH